MYEKRTSVLLRSSASALCNNLCILFDDANSNVRNVGVVHKSSVNLLTVDGEDGEQQSRQITCKGPPGYKKLVLQTKWCKLKECVVLVIAFQQGIQILDWDGSVLLFWYHFSKPETGTFGRGIAPIGDQCVGVGTHNGEVLIFDVGSKGSSVSQVASVETGPSAITDLTSDENFLTSASDDGTLHIWKQQHASHDLKKLKTIDGYGFPCTSLKMWKSLVLAAYGSGHLRLFSILTGKILCEITAHARWITALDVAPSAELALSTSEDSFVRIWKLSQTDIYMNHICTIQVQDVELCGGCFADPFGKSFVVSGYEMEELIIYASENKDKLI